MQIEWSRWASTMSIPTRRWMAAPGPVATTVPDPSLPTGSDWPMPITSHSSLTQRHQLRSRLADVDQPDPFRTAFLDSADGSDNAAPAPPLNFMID